MGFVVGITCETLIIFSFIVVQAPGDGVNALTKVLIDIENGDQPKAQTTENVTFAPKITKEEEKNED